MLDVYNKTDGPQEVDTARFEADYRDILDRSRAQNPEVRIVLAEPFILPVGMWQEHYTHWRAQCDRLGAVVKKLAKEYDAVFLPYQGLFDKLAHDGRIPEVIVLDVGRYAPHGGRSRKRWPNYGCRE
ncbi:MAG: SGNH/GDSL hydrolase family protein [Alistipes indistinctus]